MLDRLGIADKKSYIASGFPEAVALDSVAIAPQMQAQLEAAIDEALSSSGWIDAMSHLPTTLNATDVSSLLERVLSHLGKGPHPKLLAGTCMTSNAFLEGLRQKGFELAREAAAQTLSAQKAPSASARSANPSKGFKESVVSKTQDDSDDDWDIGKGGSKKKKAGRKRNPGKARAAVGTQQGDSLLKNTSGHQSKESPVAQLSLESIASKVEEWAPETSGCGEAGNLPEVLAERIRPDTLVEYEKTLAAIFSAGAEARRRRRDETAKVVGELNQRFNLYAHGAELANQDEVTRLHLERHLLRSIGQDLLDLILRYQEVDLQNGEDAANGEEPERKQEHLQPLNAPHRNHLLKNLPADAVRAAQAAQDALATSDCQEAQERLTDAALAAGLQLRKLDKKAEKQLVQSLQLKLQEKLKTQSSPADILANTVPILVAKVYGRATSIPGKALAGMITILKPSLEAESATKLEQFHSLVVESLKSQTNEPNPKLEDLKQEVLSLCFS